MQVLIILIVASTSFVNKAYAGPIQANDIISTQPHQEEEQMFSVPMDSIETTATFTMPAAQEATFKSIWKVLERFKADAPMPWWLDNLLAFVGAGEQRMQHFS
jgi:hypothetical protein